MTKHNKYYWDLDRNKPYKPYKKYNKNSASSHAPSSDSQFKSVYVGENGTEFKEDLDNHFEEWLKITLANRKKKREINIIVTGFRILGYAFIPFNLVLATCVLILSELISWILIFDN